MSDDNLARWKNLIYLEHFAKNPGSWLFLMKIISIIEYNSNKFRRAMVAGLRAQIIKKYGLVELSGEGDFGVVFRACLSLPVGRREK